MGFKIYKVSLGVGYPQYKSRLYRWSTYYWCLCLHMNQLPPSPALPFLTTVFSWYWTGWLSHHISSSTCSGIEPVGTIGTSISGGRIPLLLPDWQCQSTDPHPWKSPTEALTWHQYPTAANAIYRYYEAANKTQNWELFLRGKVRYKCRVCC